MIEQSCPRNLLLVASTETLAPFTSSIPASFSFNNMIHLNNGQDFQEVLVGNAGYTDPGSNRSYSEKSMLTSFHVGFVVWVDDLVSEGSETEVRPLRDEDELRCRGLTHDSACRKVQMICFAI